jgi:hypothetical protein
VWECSGAVENTTIKNDVNVRRNKKKFHATCMNDEIDGWRENLLGQEGHSGNL